MSSRAYSFLAATACALVMWVFTTKSAAAQSADPVTQHQHVSEPTPSESEPPQHDMQHMHVDGGEMVMPPAREGSDTSWLPDETPMYAVHQQAGSWTLMAHGNAFLQYLH